MYYLSVFLQPLSGEGLFGYRIILTFPFMFMFLFFNNKYKLELYVFFMLLKQKPKMILLFCLTSFLNGIQMWLYLWAPSNGFAIDVSIGYLILPIMMVVFGKFWFKEKISKLKYISIFFAAVGVSFSIIVSGGISWQSAVVFIVHPIYFSLRKHFNVAYLSSFVFEIFLLLPICFYFVSIIDLSEVLLKNDKIYYLLMLLGLISATSLMSQMVACSITPINLFGLLMYIEPLLMLLASFAIGESLQSKSYFLMFCLILAIIFLIIDGIITIKGDKNEFKR